MTQSFEIKRKQTSVQKKSEYLKAILRGSESNKRAQRYISCYVLVQPCISK